MNSFHNISFMLLTIHRFAGFTAFCIGSSNLTIFKLTEASLLFDNLDNFYNFSLFYLWFLSCFRMIQTKPIFTRSKETILLITLRIHNINHVSFFVFSAKLRLFSTNNAETRAFSTIGLLT